MAGRTRVNKAIFNEIEKICHKYGLSFTSSTHFHTDGDAQRVIVTEDYPQSGYWIVIEPRQFGGETPTHIRLSPTDQRPPKDTPPHQQHSTRIPLADPDLFARIEDRISLISTEETRTKKNQEK